MLDQNTSAEAQKVQEEIKAEEIKAETSNVVPDQEGTSEEEGEAGGSKAKAPKRTRAKRTPKAKPSKPARCTVKGCSTKPFAPRARFCAKHKKERRAKQTAARNAEWRARVRAGEAGHHKQYAGKPSLWAKKNPKLVKKLKDAHLNTAQVTELKKTDRLTRDRVLRSKVA